MRCKIDDYTLGDLIIDEYLNIPPGEYEGVWHDDHVALTLRLTIEDKLIEQVTLQLCSDNFPKLKILGEMQARVVVEQNGDIRAEAITPTQPQTRPQESSS